MAYNSRYLGGYSRPNPYQPTPVGNPRSNMIAAGVVNRGNQGIADIYLGGYAQPPGGGAPGPFTRPPPAPGGGPVPRDRPPPAPPGGGPPGPVGPPGPFTRPPPAPGGGPVPGRQPPPYTPPGGGAPGPVPRPGPAPNLGPSVPPAMTWGGRAGNLNLGGYGTPAGYAGPAWPLPGSSLTGPPLPPRYLGGYSRGGW